MYRLYKTMSNRFEQIFLTKSQLTQNGLIGDTVLKVNDTSPFTKEFVNNSFPEIFIMDNATTFKAIPNGREGAQLVRIKGVIDENTLELQQPLTRNWMTSANSFLRRAVVGKSNGSGADVVNKIIIGDIEVIDNFSAISIIPQSKTINWKTLSSTTDKVTIDFVVYTMKKNNTDATESIMILADIVEWILMSKLHIQPFGFKNPWEVTNIARVTNISYGTIAKGSAFLKAATISWEAEMHFWRGYLTQQGITDDYNFDYGNLDNLGPLHNE